MGALVNKAAVHEDPYQNKTIDSLPTEILLPLLKAAAGNQVVNLAKLKLVCRRFNSIIKSKSIEFPMVHIQTLKFSQTERNETIFDHFVHGSLPVYVSIRKAEENKPPSGRFLTLRGSWDLIDLPLVPFIAPNDPKITDLLRHFKMTGGKLRFWTMKVNDKLISELLSLDLSTVEELKFYKVKLTASPLLLKSLFEKMRYALRDLKLHFCRFPAALISDDLLSVLVNLKTLSIKENSCGEIFELPNLTLSNGQNDMGRKIVRCGPDLRIT
uniref:F-box domain-containing protein n=1 Tax=Plectus sambesii TaxID=2011161 RepID=A0A914W899_9BILA